MNPYPPYPSYPPNGGPSGPPGGYTSYPPHNRGPPAPYPSHSNAPPLARDYPPYGEPAYRGGGAPPPPPMSDHGRDYRDQRDRDMRERDSRPQGYDRDGRDNRGGYDARGGRGGDPRRDPGPGPGPGSYGPPIGGSGYGGPPPSHAPIPYGGMNSGHGQNGGPRDDYYNRPGNSGSYSGPPPLHSGPPPPSHSNFVTQSHANARGNAGNRQPLPPQEQFAPQGHRRPEHGDHAPNQGPGPGPGPSFGQGPSQQHGAPYGQQGRFDDRPGRPGPPSYGNGSGNGSGYDDRGAGARDRDRYSQNGPPGPPGPPPMRFEGRPGDRRERSPIRRAKQNDRPRTHVAIDRDGRSVESRLQLERQCRTLFVRNVSYDADSSVLRADFERFGQIKTYFDIVKNRGMVFITYYDLRHAEEARAKMHGSMVRGREMDVHYSLPRGDDRSKDPDRDSNQGSLMVTLHGAPNLAEHDLGGLAGRYGDIRAIRPGPYPEQKVVDYFDSRGAVMFYDEMHQRPFLGGTLQIAFLWDEVDQQPVQLNPGQIPPSLEPSARRQGPPGDMGPPPRRGDDRDRRRDDPPRSGAGGGRYNDVPPQGGDYNRRESGGYAPPQTAGRYDSAPPRPAPGGNMQEDDRLEQARKVQNLLSSLGSMGAAPGAGTGGAGPMPGPGPGMPPPRNPDPRRQSYDYPTAPTTNMPPPTLGGGIPPEVLSLLNANNAGPGSSPGPGGAPGAMTTGTGMNMGGPTDAYRPPSAQSHTGTPSGIGGASMLPPRQTPPRPAAAGRMSASLSPVVRAAPGIGGGGGPAGGIPGLPPKPADVAVPSLNGHGNGGQARPNNTEVGNLLAMLR